MNEDQSLLPGYDAMQGETAPEAEYEAEDNYDDYDGAQDGMEEAVVAESAGSENAEFAYQPITAARQAQATSQGAAPYQSAPMALPPGMTQDEIEAINQEFFTNPAAAFERFYAARRRQEMAAEAISQQHLQGIPEGFRRVHGARMAHTLAHLDPTMRASNEGAAMSAFMALAQEAVQTGDFTGTLERALELAKGATPARSVAQQTSAPTRRPMPAEERVPSPRSAPAASVRPAGNSGGKERADVQFLMNQGLSRDEARELAAHNRRRF